MEMKTALSWLGIFAVLCASRVAVGQTEAGRYLRVIYVPEPGGAFVITAYELKGKTLDCISTAPPWERKKMRQKKFPPGWDEERVRKVIANYEQQTEEEAVAEDEAAFQRPAQTIIEVPKELLPAIRDLLAKHKESRKA
jgi:hypothetical protein